VRRQDAASLDEREAAQDDDGRAQQRQGDGDGEAVRSPRGLGLELAETSTGADRSR